jgi:archaellum component FlaF (FlaF/FlaG flagellin family)
MGLSVVISGAIIFIALMYALMNIPNVFDSILSVEEVSSEISVLEDSISQTEISINPLVTQAGKSKINFTLHNNGTEKLWNFEKFNVLVTYDEGTSMVTEDLTFSGDCVGGVPIAGNWCIQSITSDILDPGILNDGESASIRTQITQNLATQNTIAIVTTDNGVIATRSTGS